MPKEKHLVIDRKNSDGIFPREAKIKSSQYQEGKDYTVISDGVYIIHSPELRKFVLDIRDDDFFSDVPTEEELEVKVMVYRENSLVEESKEPRIKEITDQEAQQIEGSQQRPFFPKPREN